MLTMLAIVAVCLFINVASILYKLRKGSLDSWLSAILDMIITGGILCLFIGSFSALAVGTIGGAMISLVLCTPLSPFRGLGNKLTNFKEQTLNWFSNQNIMFWRKEA